MGRHAGSMGMTGLGFFFHRVGTWSPYLSYTPIMPIKAQPPFNQQ